MSVEGRTVLAVARKEFADHVRNRWILALALIFVVLTVVASLLAGGEAGGDSLLGGLEGTVTSLISISSILIPLIAIMLGYATISGEAESGALALVLAYPVNRTEILLGKLGGLASVLVVATVFGFGIGGIIVTVVAGGENVTAFLTFIGLAILLGLLYLSLAVFFSTITHRRSTSIAAGVLIFFWSMLYGTLIFGIYLATGGTLQDMLAGEPLPDWFWGSVVLSPMDMHQSAVMQAFGIEQAFGFDITPPGYMTLEYLVAVQLVWVIVPLLLAFWAFRRRDV
jgi:ABC-type transport system involved in multi-copper enzyme maturation permease subunit